MLEVGLHDERLYCPQRIGAAHGFDALLDQIKRRALAAPNQRLKAALSKSIRRISCNPPNYVGNER
jgi:hypothetical protein